MALKEHENNIITKEYNDPISNYLKRIIQRYFEIENEISQSSKEAIIIQAYTRLKEVANNRFSNFVICINERSGNIDLTIKDFNGEEAFQKNTAFNKDFCDLTDDPVEVTLWNDNTEQYTNYGQEQQGHMVKGDDDRLSNARIPLVHAHEFDDINGLEDALKLYDLINDNIHTHDNVNVLNMLLYTGARTNIDLVLLEDLIDKVEKTVERFKETDKYSTSLAQRYINQLQDIFIPLHKKIITVNNELDSWITDFTKTANDYTDSKVSSFKNEILNYLTKYLSVTEYNTLVESLNHSIRLIQTGEIDIKNLTFTNPVIKPVQTSSQQATCAGVTFQLKQGYTNLLFTSKQSQQINNIDSYQNKLNNTDCKCYVEYVKDNVTYKDPLPHIYQVKNSKHDFISIYFNTDSDNNLNIVCQRLSYLPIYLYRPLIFNAIAYDNAGNISSESISLDEAQTTQSIVNTQNNNHSTIDSASMSYDYNVNRFDPLTSSSYVKKYFTVNFSANAFQDSGQLWKSKCKISFNITQHDIFLKDNEYLYNNKIYTVVNTGGNLPWSEAKERCANMGGFLAMPKTNSEVEYLSRLTKQIGKNVWLGGTDEEQEGVWKWIDGTLIENSTNNIHWQPGQPDNAYNGTEHYMEMNCNSGQWNDLPNDGTTQDDNPYYYISGFICEKRIHVFNNGSYKKYYIVVPKQLSWHDAKNFCINTLDGLLAMPKTQEEIEFVSQIATEYGIMGLWLGGTDEAEEGVWRWADGTLITQAQSNWANGEPNNLNSNEHYMQIYTSVSGNSSGTSSSYGKWNDLNGQLTDAVNGFVCELPALAFDIELQQNINSSSWQTVNTFHKDRSSYTYSVNNYIVPFDDKNVTPLSVTGQLISSNSNTNRYRYTIEVSDVRELTLYRFLFKHKGSTMFTVGNLTLSSFSDINRIEYSLNSQNYTIVSDTNTSKYNRTIVIDETKVLNDNSNNLIFCDNNYMDTYTNITNYLSEFNAKIAIIDDTNKDYAMSIMLPQYCLDSDYRYHITNNTKYLHSSGNIVTGSDEEENYYGQFDYGKINDFLPNAKIKYQIFKVPGKGENNA